MTDLRDALLDYRTSLAGLSLSNDTDPSLAGSPKLADIRWNGALVTNIDWSQCWRLGDDPFVQSPISVVRAWRRLRHRSHKIWSWRGRRDRRIGQIVFADKTQRLRARVRAGRASQLDRLTEAIRANRQIATLLKEQGLREEAVRFDYRTSQLGRRRPPLMRGWLLAVPGSGRFRQTTHLIRRSASVLIDLICGYGTRPARILATYLLTILVFALVYDRWGSDLQNSFSVHGWNAIWFSLIAFHGRGVVNGGVDTNSGLLAVAAIEAAVGLLVEATFIATLLRSLFRD